jgi:glutamate racemase
MNRPIGIFDSGLGGLTVLSAVREQLPHENIVYFGDTARVPYGSKSKEAVTGYSRQIAAFLLSHDVKMIIIACNTASAYALEALRKSVAVPVVGVIEPGAHFAAGISRTGRIGVIGTEGTIRSSSYTAAIRRCDKRATVIAQACPLFVPLVEEGWLDHPVTRQVAREYLSLFAQHKIDTLVLGCTHYPLLRSVIQKIVGKHVRLVDSAEATARQVSEILARDGCATTRQRAGSYTFYSSDAPQKFQELGERFLGRSMSSVKKVIL